MSESFTTGSSAIPPELSRSAAVDYARRRRQATTPIDDVPEAALSVEDRHVEKLKIPEGTQSGAVFRIKGHGLPDPRGGGKGDLYYHVRVMTPSKLTREQRKIMEQLGLTLKVDNKPAERGSSFFDKVKDIFG